MRKQMLENAAFEVATQVRAVEDSIDSTLIELAELQSRMMRINVGPAPIHAALEDVSAALGKLIAARGSIVNCHRQLADAKGKVPGLRTVAFGDEGPCPETTGAANLRIVA